MATDAPVPPTFDPDVHPHRRYNPLLEEHVLVSPHRANRPWQGQVEEPQKLDVPQYDPKCYLCPGNSRTSGHQNPQYTSVYTFGNDFAAVLAPPRPVVPDANARHPLLRIEPVDGACDVVVFHPRHDLTLARLNVDDVGKVIDEWCRIYELRGLQANVRNVQIFENKGAMMGCSNPHPHGQAWSTSSIPNVPSKELESLRKYASSTTPSDSGAPNGPKGKSCLLCDYAHLEASDTSSEDRVVVKNEHWIAVVPWWAIWPFEILLLPYKRHVPSLLHLTADEKTSFADVLSKITIRYDNLFSCSFPYSMGIHQRPTPAKGETPEDNEDDIAHLHVHFEPPLLRSSTVRKFLVGYELMSEPQRDLSPEQAAAKLCACSNIHYMNQE